MQGEVIPGYLDQEGGFFRGEKRGGVPISDVIADLKQYGTKEHDERYERFLEDFELEKEITKDCTPVIRVRKTPETTALLKEKLGVSVGPSLPGK